VTVRAGPASGPASRFLLKFLYSEFIDVGNLPTYFNPMKRYRLISAWFLAVLLLAGCAEGSAGTPGTATVHLDGSADFFAGTGSSH
jgi:hypothetical protein